MKNTAALIAIAASLAVVPAAQAQIVGDVTGQVDTTVDGAVGLPDPTLPDTSADTAQEAIDAARERSEDRLDQTEEAVDQALDETEEAIDDTTDVEGDVGVDTSVDVETPGADTSVDADGNVTVDTDPVG